LPSFLEERRLGKAPSRSERRTPRHLHPGSARPLHRSGKEASRSEWNLAGKVALAAKVALVAKVALAAKVRLL